MQSLLFASQNFYCGEAAPFFGFMGVSSALVFANLGAAYGTAKSGVGISSMGVMNPEAVMKNIIPVVMAGVLGIYGLIISVILIQGIQSHREQQTERQRQRRRSACGAVRPSSHIATAPAVHSLIRALDVAATHRLCVETK